MTLQKSIYMQKLDVFMREQSKIVEQNAPPEPTTARIVISGKAKKGKRKSRIQSHGNGMERRRS